MGFFSRLKSMAQAVTGGGAKVHLEVIEPTLRSPFIVRISAEVSDNDLEINKVYLLIRAEEEVVIHNLDIATREGDGVSVRNEDVKAETETLRLEIEVSGSETLEANQTYEWECEVTLPDDALPTFHGINAHHAYAMQAGLDCFGNDPDSGWLEVNIY